MNIITVVGARPQFVKAATVSRAIQKRNQQNSILDIEEKIIHTGQHYDANMSDIFFDEMQIPKPAFTLGIGGGSHGSMTGQQIEKIEEILLDEKPDCVLVYGDTNSTLAGALAAAKLYIPVHHVEAGLRSFNMQMPEEVNRILTDNVSSKLFCPTETAIQNLMNEGFEKRDCEILNVGDVMFDAAMFYAPQSTKPATLASSTEPFSLVTIHRAENTDNLERLTSIIEALNEIAKDSTVICPLHPRTQKTIESSGMEFNATILQPVGYFEMIWLLQNCSTVLTDSGGLQKEAYFFNKPCITMRDQTEWVELVKAGANTLVGADQKSIVSAFKNCDGRTIDPTENLYGDGHAADKIVDAIFVS